MIELLAMLITTGQVQNGAIEVDNSLPEGAKVTILVHEDDETFEVSAEDEPNCWRRLRKRSEVMDGKA